MTEEQRLAKNASIKEAMKATHEKRKSQVSWVETRSSPPLGGG